MLSLLFNNKKQEKCNNLTGCLIKSVLYVVLLLKQMQMQQRGMNADLQLKEAQAAKAMAEAQKAAQPEVPAQVDNSQAQLRAFEIQAQSQLKREAMAQHHQCLQLQEESRASAVLRALQVSLPTRAGLRRRRHT